MAYTTIDNPELYFQTQLYTGNANDGSGTTQAVTLGGSEDMQPDLVWIKSRSATKSYYFFDVIRGVTKELNTNNQNDENTNAQGLQSFNSDGFTLGHEPEMNENGTTYCSWNWLAGGSASSNTQGNVTTSVSANTTAGFSVVTYSGNGGALTIGHGLGAKPSMIFIKNRTDDGSDWIIGHKDGGGFDNNKFLKFSNASTFTNSVVFGTAPATTTLALSTGNASNISASSKDFVAYCFAGKKGYSKFGKYEGASSTDGSFIYTGFKPAFFMAKAIGRSENWYIFDNKRLGYNVENAQLYPDVNNTEATTDYLDFLSNGVKYRYNSVGLNGTGEEYIYMAFAENPFVNSNGIPGLAR